MIKIRAFENTQDDYEAYSHIRNTVWRTTTYTPDDLRHHDNDLTPQYAHHRYLAEVDDAIVGYASFERNLKFYHPQRFWIYLDVLPDARQQGVGTTLFDHMLEVMTSEFHANEIHTITTESRDHSLQFLKKRGFEVGKRDPKSRLDVAKFDASKFQDVIAKVYAAGIKIKALSDLLEQDADALHKVYEVHQTLVNDVPEPAEHTRIEFEDWKGGYSTDYPYFIPDANFMALDGKDYIGLASLWGVVSGQKLYNGMTGVLRSHRRKGIASALKIRTFEYARAHGTRYIMTQNNEDNPMYQLNLKLGFKTYDVEIKLVKKI